MSSFSKAELFSLFVILLTLLLTLFVSLCLRFQSEKETGDRNFAIGYYLKEKKVSEGQGRWEHFNYSSSGTHLLITF